MGRNPRLSPSPASRPPAPSHQRAGRRGRLGQSRSAAGTGRRLGLRDARSRSSARGFGAIWERRDRATSTSAIRWPACACRSTTWARRRPWSACAWTRRCRSCEWRPAMSVAHRHSYYECRHASASRGLLDAGSFHEWLPPAGRVMSPHLAQLDLPGRIRRRHRRRPRPLRGQRVLRRRAGRPVHGRRRRRGARRQARRPAARVPLRRAARRRCCCCSIPAACACTKPMPG